MYAEDPKLLDPAADAAIRANPPAEVYPRSKGVYVEWIEACKGNGKALSAFDGHAGALTEMVVLGCLAVRWGAPIDVDPATGRVLTAIPAEWMQPAFRPGWGL